MRPIELRKIGRRGVALVSIFYLWLRNDRADAVITALAVCLGISACTTAPIHSSTLSLTGESVYVLPTEMCGDYFVAPVLINGHGPYPLLLDTGAGTTIIDTELAGEIGLGRRADLGVGALAVQGARVRKSGMDALSIALGRRIDGILGHPVFRDYLLTYDFDEDRILLSDGRLSTGGTDVIATSQGTRPFVDADVAGQPVSILIDTGLSGGLTLVDVDDLDFSQPVQVTGARMRIDGLHLVESGRLAGTTTLGPMVLDAPIVNKSVSVDLIGQKYLSRYNLTFDQKNALMRFEWIGGDEGTPISTDPLRGTGVVVAPVGDTWQVIRVDPDTEFENGTLEVGDTITVVDGKPVTERSCPVPNKVEEVREWTEYLTTRLQQPVRARIRALVR